MNNYLLHRSSTAARVKANGVVHNPYSHFTVTLSRSPNLYCLNDITRTLKESAARSFSIFRMSPDTHLSTYPPAVIFSCVHITGSCYITTIFSHFSSHCLPCTLTPMKRSKLNPFPSSGDTLCYNSCHINYTVADICKHSQNC